MEFPLPGVLEIRPSSEWVRVSASAENFWDQSGDYNNTDSVFTAPIDGKYFFSGTGRLNDIPGNTTQYPWARITTSNRNYRGDLIDLHNTSDTGVSLVYMSPRQYIQVTSTCIADMEEGDTADFAMRISDATGHPDGTTDIYGHPTIMQTYWQGWLMG